MRLTGYVLIAIGALIAVYLVVTNLIVNVRPIEQDAVGGGSTYWFVMIPAAGAILLGLWLVFTGDKGYRETYDMRRQQS